MALHQPGLLGFEDHQGALTKSGRGLLAILSENHRYTFDAGEICLTSDTQLTGQTLSRSPRC